VQGPPPGAPPHPAPASASLCFKSLGVRREEGCHSKPLKIPPERPFKESATREGAEEHNLPDLDLAASPAASLVGSAGQSEVRHLGGGRQPERSGCARGVGSPHVGDDRRLRVKAGALDRATPCVERQGLSERGRGGGAREGADHGYGGCRGPVVRPVARPVERPGLQFEAEESRVVPP